MPKVKKAGNVWGAVMYYAVFSTIVYRVWKLTVKFHFVCGLNKGKPKTERKFFL